MLIKNSIIYLTSIVASSFISFLMIPIYANYLSPKEYGIYGILVVVNSIIAIFIGGNIFVMIGREFYNLKNKINYFFNIYAYIFIMFMIIEILLYFFSAKIIDYFNFGCTESWLYLIGFIAFEQIVLHIYLTILRFENLALKYLYFSVFISFLNALLTYYFLFYGLLWQSFFIANLITYSTVFLFLFYKYRKILIDKNNYKLNLEHIKESFKFVLTYSPTTLNWRVISFSDRFFITKMASMSSLGLYTMGFQLSKALEIFTSGFNQAFTPYFMKKIKDKEYKKLTQISFIFLIILILIILGLFIFFPSIIKFFLNPDYYKAIKFFNYFLLIVFFNAVHQIISKFLVYYKYEKYISYSTTIGMIFNLLLNYILIGYNAALGAVQATLLSYIIIILLEAWYLFKIRKVMI